MAAIREGGRWVRKATAARRLGVAKHTVEAMALRREIEILPLDDGGYLVSVESIEQVLAHRESRISAA